MTYSLFLELEAPPTPRPRARVVRGQVFIHPDTSSPSGKACVAFRRAVLRAELSDGSGLLLPMTLAEPAIPNGVPVRLCIDASYRRPASHLTKSGGLRASAPRYFLAQKPDIENMTKTVMDALTERGLWHDDAQVASLRVDQNWTTADTGSTLITVEVIG